MSDDRLNNGCKDCYSCDSIVSLAVTHQLISFKIPRDSLGNCKHSTFMGLKKNSLKYEEL